MKFHLITVVLLSSALRATAAEPKNIGRMFKRDALISLTEFRNSRKKPYTDRTANQLAFFDATGKKTKTVELTADSSVVELPTRVMILRDRNAIDLFDWEGRQVQSGGTPPRTENQDSFIFVSSDASRYTLLIGQSSAPKSTPGNSGLGFLFKFTESGDLLTSFEPGLWSYTNYQSTSGPHAIIPFLSLESGKLELAYGYVMGPRISTHPVLGIDVAGQSFWRLDARPVPYPCNASNPDCCPVGSLYPRGSISEAHVTLADDCSFAIINLERRENTTDWHEAYLIDGTLTPIWHSRTPAGVISEMGILAPGSFWIRRGDQVEIGHFVD